MKTRVAICLVLLGLSLILFGCGSQGVQKTGFLSDYSGLRAESDTEMRYVAPRFKVDDYARFIVDPVTVYLHGESKAVDIPAKELAELREYTYQAVYNALLDHYSIVRQPGPGVARLRIALTDIQKSSTALNVIPQTKLAGVGLGGASMEAELVDSVTGEQIAAVVQAQKGNRLSLDGLSKYGDAKAVIDDWAESLVRRLDAAHSERLRTSRQ